MTEPSPSSRLSLALVAQAEAGILPPCRYGDEWLSDDADERAVAVTWCRPCGVIAECAAAAADKREKFGVWGGRDRTVRNRREARDDTDEGAA